MSNRVRQRGGGRARPSTGRSYTARLERARPYKPPRPWGPQAVAALTRVLPGWLTVPQAAVLLVLVAEIGHLVAAWTEWPTSAGRGWFQVVVAGLLGMAAVAIYFDPVRTPATAGLAATVLVPLSWAVGALAGASPYARYPAGAAAAVTVAEVAAAALLAIVVADLAQAPARRQAVRREDPHRAR